MALSASGDGAGNTYIDDVLNLAENSGNRLTDEGDSVEEAGLANEDVEESLVDADELLRFRLAGIVGMRSGIIVPRGKHRRWHRSQVRREQEACCSSG